MSAPIAIQTRALGKSFGSRVAIDHLDLSVSTGEVFGFLGPNGAGKTTTIRILLDLLRPSSGEVSVLGLYPRRDGAALRRRIGYLPGQFVIYDRQSAGDALGDLARLRGGVGAGRIAGLAERLGLDLTRTVRELSKGNRQKVGLIQAFMHEPELLILDEPTDGLDPLLRQCFVEMVDEVRADGRTVFLSSHNLAEVQATADRVAMIRTGQLVAVDTVSGLRERALRRVEIEFETPVSAADFVSVANFEQGEVEPIGHAAWVVRGRLAGAADALVKAAAAHTVRTLTVAEPDLDEVFRTLYQGPAA